MRHPRAEHRAPELIVQAPRREERLPWPVAALFIAALTAGLWGGFGPLMARLLT
jgi:hypothetical protein